ncbi:MAG: hypothetical protein KGS45_07755 [Planctomycetes bacterium]|nr:hypothetical protein [Planctomycetota bacterium]
MITARPAVTVAALAAFAAMFAGCNRQNHSLKLGQALELETFRTTAVEPAATLAVPTGVLANATTQTGMRDAWAQTEVEVPNDGVYHRPLYKTEYSRVKYTPRNRGEFPTAETALDLQDKQATVKQIKETFIFTPGVLIYDTVTAPFRMVIHPATQSNVKVSPRLPRPGYQRWMHDPSEAGADAPAIEPTTTTEVKTETSSDGTVTTTTTTTTTTVTTTTKTEKTETTKPIETSK